MKIKYITFALAVTVTITSAPAQEKTPGYNHKIPEKIMTPDKVETSIGTLEFFDGMPKPDTVDKLYDNLLQLRGVETFLNGIPATSIEGLRLGHLDLGLDAYHKFMITDKLLDSSPLFLTGNTDTVYCSGFLDLKKDGAMVVEIPAKCGPGTVNDAYFRFVVDMGIPGPDRGAGGTAVTVAARDIGGQHPAGAGLIEQGRGDIVDVDLRPPPPG